MCLLLPAGVAGFAACSSTTTATVTDGGTDARAKTKDGGKQAGNDASAEASCAVDAGPLQDAEIKLGLALVTSHGCFTCHGGALEGNDDGVQSTVEGGVAYPPNLTPDPATGLGCWTNAQIKNAFLNGFDNMDAAICNPMPHFGHIAGEAGLNDAEATAVVQFLRSIPPLVNNPPNTPSCRLSWDAEMDTGAADRSTPDATPGRTRAGTRPSSRPATTRPPTRRTPTTEGRTTPRRATGRATGDPTGTTDAPVPPGTRSPRPGIRSERPSFPIPTPSGSIPGRGGASDGCMAGEDPRAGRLLASWRARPGRLE